MAMVVKNNMSAVNTLGVLNKNSKALSKSLGKVSSGMKINSAEDDASGYAISERMRVMIRSLDQADQNAKNGLSMMKVAEGAVSSTVDILRTMKEKAINAANDSNTDADRAAIQKELDQSIDQIDDNALITYNGKTLVDGSKMAKGDATKTSLTNQSLHEDTNGDTKLVDLQNRNGERLNIQTTDTLTVSYVIQGRMYSKDISISADKSLNNVLYEASEPYTRESPLLAAAWSTYDSSVASANAVYQTAYSNAVSTYNSTVSSATTTYNQAVANANATGVTYNNQNMTLQEAVASAAADIASDQQAYNDAVNFLASHPADDPIWNTMPPGVTYNSYSNSTVPTLSTTLSTNSASYNAFSTQLSTLISTASSTFGDTMGTATTNRDNDISTASTVLSDAISTAMSTLGEDLGDVVPYKLTVDASNVVGMDAAGDTVYTANREKAITITAGSAGTKYQISGLTFSVKDSQGQVKKSVNAVLDNFNESVRSVNKSNDNAINLQVGTKANQTIRIGLTDMRSEALGLKSSSGETISVATQKHANAVVNVLDNAIQKALDQQTDIGAVEARLEMTSSNLVLSSQNVQASESVIRDADMAREMTEFTKNNVLLQAAQSMLAQANQSSSNVLSLLQ